MKQTSDRPAIELGFHTQNGLHFNRTATGHVVATMVPTPCPSPDDVQILFTLDPDTWASVVAHVSALGSTSEGYAAAQKLHRG